MIGKNKRFPKDVIDSWPEVFEEVKLNVLPLRYLHMVLITFKDNTTWEVKITPKVKKEGWDSLQAMLKDIFQHYGRNIANVDFKLDSERVKKDIQRKTKKFLYNKTL